MSSDTVVPAVLTLSDGMVGLPDVRTLDLVAVAGGQFLELVARELPGLGWLAAAAEDVRPGITERLSASGHISAGEQVLVLLTSHGDPAVVTANLAGPLVVAPDGAARQLVLEDPWYELRASVGRLAPAEEG